MKKLVFVLILQLYNTPQISAQPDTLYDVFPLAKWNQYNYDYQFIDSIYYNFGGLETTQKDSGQISYLIIDSTFLDDKIEWLIERKINLLENLSIINLDLTQLI